jgi:hypothetical protein
VFNLPLACISEAIGIHLGTSVGQVVSVDANEDGVGWGVFLRVQIRLDIFKPLMRGWVLKFNGETIWVSFSI